MKILFVIDTLGSGGKERRLTELLKALKTRQEIEFELVVMSNDIHYTEILDLGIKIHRIIRRSSKDLSVFKKFWLRIKEYNPDAVHCWESMTAVYLAPVCFLLRCSLINGMVTNAPANQHMKNHHWRRGRLTFPFSKFVVSNSVAGLEAYRVPERKGVIIPNGFNFERLNKIAGEEHIREELKIETEHIVGMVASFSGQKDYSTYFKAAQLVLEKRDDVTFLAIGPGTDSALAWNLVKTKNKNFFRLLGKRDDVENLVNALDIGVLATFTEGISNSILEYMGFGKPVIATEGGGTGEIVLDGITGFLVQPENPSEMANKIEALLNNRELRKGMGGAGLERVSSGFSIEAMVGKYIDLYRKVTNKN
ncbi:MAG: glycosyltransferase [Bacteroidales bacterium]|nr:glycosyltransferase [Bacteroidales bacterium]